MNSITLYIAHCNYLLLRLFVHSIQFDFECEISKETNCIILDGCFNGCYLHLITCKPKTAYIKCSFQFYPICHFQSSCGNCFRFPSKYYRTLYRYRNEHFVLRRQTIKSILLKKKHTHTSLRHSKLNLTDYMV